MFQYRRYRSASSFSCLPLLFALAAHARAENPACDARTLPQVAGMSASLSAPLQNCLDAAQALARARNYSDAITLISAVQKAAPAASAPHLARAQFEWDSLNWVETLRAYDQVLSNDPHNVTAQEGRLLVLSKMNLPTQALAQSRTMPGVRSAVVQQLHEDETALAIRWSEKVYYAKPGEQFPVLDRAIAMAEVNLQRYPNSTRSRFDYVRALNNRQRSTDAIAAYQQLQREHFTIPAYVHQSAGSAYLAQKQPEQAVVALRLALAGDPDDVAANLGLFYALVDLADFPAAQRHIDAYAARNNLPSDKFDAVMASIMERAFENRLDEAQARLQNLADEAPSSEPLRLALGKIALWRGWPRQALDQAQLVTLREADDLHANILLADAEAALGDYASSNRRLARLRALVPQDPDVRTLSRAATLRDMNEIAVTTVATRSKENLGDGHGAVLDVRAFGHPLALQTRPFVHSYFERTRGEGEQADYRRLGVGADFTFARTGTLRAELQQEFFRVHKTSLLLAGELGLDDYWSLTGGLDTNSIEVPLKARSAGIAGNAVQLGANYRISERLGFGVSAARLQMSDGNTRRTFGMRAHANLIEGAYYKSGLDATWSLVQNSLADTSYFNPLRSQSTELSWVNEWMTYQRYTRTFSQQLALNIGRTAESGFASGTTGSIGYSQHVGVSDTLALNYGVGWVRRLYSGAFSTGPEANLTLNWKF